MDSNPLVGLDLVTARNLAMSLGGRRRNSAIVNRDFDLRLSQFDTGEINQRAWFRRIEASHAFVQKAESTCRLQAQNGVLLNDIAPLP